MKAIITMICLAAFTVSAADAHYTQDAPWFFERTVYIQSNNTTQAGIVWDANTIVTSSHGLTSGVIHVTDVYGNDIPATLLVADPYSDVAVIQAYPDADVTYSHTGVHTIEPLYAEPGDMIYAVGHPKDRPYVVTMGVVSSVQHAAPVSIIHDADVSTGSSGGPVFGVRGGLVGMTVASDDLAFAVPYDTLHAVVQSVHDTGTYAPACIGITLDDHTIRTVRDGVTGIYPSDVVLSIDGKEPFELQYTRMAGEYSTIQLQDRTVQVQLGYMTQWFGIHKCVEQYDTFSIEHLQVHHAGNTTYISGVVHNRADTPITSLTLDRLIAGDTHITQNATTGDLILNGVPSTAKSGYTTFHYGDGMDIDLTGLTISPNLPFGVLPMEQKYFAIVITGISIPTDQPIRVSILGTGEPTLVATYTAQP